MPPAGSEPWYDPYAFSVHDDPDATYRWLRDEEPAWWNPDLRFWALSRYADVLDGFRDHRTYSSAGGIALENRRPIGRRSGVFDQMIELDPPEHTAFRMLVSNVFTPKRVAAMEDEVRRIVSGYLDAVVPLGRADLVADVSGPFPMDVIAAILGLPARDRPQLRRLADQILIREDGSPVMPAVALEGMFGLLEYFVEDIRARRAGGPDGLITDLARAEVEGRALSDQELLGFCVLFVVAGHETTTKLVANAIELLSRHPEQRAALVADPAGIPSAVEEVLRFRSSTQYMHRTVTRDLELHGRRLHAGDSVLLLIGAANHDEREFGPDAETFDITRPPARHLAFGYGAHFCLGAALARLETRIALEEIHHRIPDYVVDHDAAVRFHSSNVAGWTSLPITFTPGRAA